MKTRRLGRTGLTVSVLGLGTGTRFGDGRSHDQAAATRLVRGALDLGVNYFDTAAMYLGAEEMLGQALQGIPRERYVVATKFFPRDDAGERLAPGMLRASVERSLRRLRLESIDVLQVHGCRPAWLAPTLATLGEELEQLRHEGKFRFLGAGETILEDATHAMVPAAVDTGRFDQALIGYHLLSPSAEREALPACAQRDVGVVAMVAVRRALREPAFLRELLAAAVARGEIDPDEVEPRNPLGWLLDDDSPTLALAGLRFAVSHPAVACVIAGTLNLDHLRENIAAVNASPLAPEKLARLRGLFRRADPRNWVLHRL